MSPYVINPFGSFGPEAIAGMLAWYKADAGVYTDAGSTLATNGQSVQQWNDQSGNGNHATQGTSANRPIYTTGVINGRPVVRFDGVNDGLLGVTRSGAISVVCVYSIKASINATCRAFNGGTNTFFVGSDTNSVGNSAFQRAHINGTYCDDRRCRSALDQYVRGVLTWDGSTTVKYYRDGLDHTAASPGSGANLGQLQLGSVTSPLNGDLCEVIVYDHALSAGDVTTLDLYLATRWGNPSPFGVSPAGLTDCCGWWKADAGVYKDAGSTLAADTETCQQWNDQSGYGNHATQATSGKRPVYRTGIANGLPILRLDNSDDDLVGPEVSYKNFTIGIVYARRNGTTGNHRALQGSSNWLLGPYTGLHRNYQGGFVDDGTVTVVQNVFVRSVCDNDATNSHFFVNNVAHGSAGSTNVPTILHVGAGGAFAEPLDGDIAEIVLFPYVLSSGERATLDTYFQRWF